MTIDMQPGDISHIIQLAIAPVFLLTGVAGKLTVLTNRLGRIIDRSRVLEERIHATETAGPSDAYAELESLYRRAHLINRAITLSTACGLLVCLVIASLFIGGTLKLQLSRMIAVMFVLCMLSLIGSFIYLLREIFLATRTMSMRRLLMQK